jgi:hypothetical protein
MTWTHVCDGGAVGDGQGGDAVAEELDKLSDNADLGTKEGSYYVLTSLYLYLYLTHQRSITIYVIGGGK